MINQKWTILFNFKKIAISPPVYNFLSVHLLVKRSSVVFRDVQIIVNVVAVHTVVVVDNLADNYVAIVLL